MHAACDAALTTTVPFTLKQIGSDDHAGYIVRRVTINRHARELPSGLLIKRVGEGDRLVQHMHHRARGENLGCLGIPQIQ